MPPGHNLATVCALIGEPTRAAMLLELMAGFALTATELATRARVAPSTASDHLAKLVVGGLVNCTPQGRHRYYGLASVDVARLIEALGTLTDTMARPHATRANAVEGLRFARTCYDHLAGRLGVDVAAALIRRGAVRLEGDAFRLTPQGDSWMVAFGVDLGAARRKRRAFTRACLDWTERRPHLAGALGSAVLMRLLQLGWLERTQGERVLHLTPRGAAGLHAQLGLALPTA
ncbi:MAG: winged helix-turn-helix domain-containing protein [Chloroflexota bacterium]